MFSLVGDTLILPIDLLTSKGRRAQLHVKLEGANPSGSVKDRAAVAMIRGPMIADRCNSVTRCWMPPAATWPARWQCSIVRSVSRSALSATTHLPRTSVGSSVTSATAWSTTTSVSTPSTATASAGRC